MAIYTFWPYAYHDKFILERPLLRQKTSGRYAKLYRTTTHKQEKSKLAEDLYLLSMGNLYREELEQGIISADMEIADLSVFAVCHELRYTGSGIC